MNLNQKTADWASIGGFKYKKYENIELVEVDGVIRVKSKKTGELMKHSVGPARVKAVSLHG